ncbi:MAG: asparagine synthase (glutamine-hydrolyzing) [Hyphomicrobiales bacterium]|nr:asparagine synthase (glutamine-hydrolyzing) [Hyphomicrobiales bacterium]
MCGIAGILLFPDGANPRRLAAVEGMADALYHRGPDGGSVWLDREAGIAFGHRRLAIVDLSEAGRQPMFSASERLVMTYNGEIYNFAELRKELEEQGHRFRGHSDSEVMLEAFEKYGVEASLARLAGMFAIGLWDRDERVLHLIRDRMGKKPLYVALTDKALLFASELKAFRAFPGFAPRIDARTLAMVLRRGWAADDSCIFEGVFKLPAGAMLSVRADELVTASADRLRQRARPWWSLAEVAELGQRRQFALDPGELEGELDRLLRHVVRQRMVADVPLGAFLSGGIDSSAVVALMQAQSSRPVRTFTIGFSEGHYDEARHAARIAHHLGTDHTEFKLTPDKALAVIPELPRIWDEPFADESQIPTLLLSRLARQHVTVALSGDGGDECFGGYARHFMLSRLAPAFRVPVMARRMAGRALTLLNAQTMDGLLATIPVSDRLRRMLKSENLQKIARVLDVPDESVLYERLISTGAHSLGAPMERSAGHDDGRDNGAVPSLPDAVGRLIYRDMTGYLPGDILVKLDRATMAASLEGRCPFLDHRVVEFAWRLPTSVKVRNGEGKWLLRQVLRRYLPEALFERPKQGFNVPIGAWLVGPLRDWAQDLLDRSKIQETGFFDAARVETCWREHLSGRRDRASELWAVLMVQAWLDGLGSPPLPIRSASDDIAASGPARSPVQRIEESRAYG